MKIAIGLLSFMLMPLGAATAQEAAPPAPPPAPTQEATPPVTEKPKSQYAADNITPPAPGKGQVIFYRRGGFGGSAISCAVSDENHQRLTHLPPGRFSAVDVEPGLRLFSVSSEATDVMRVQVEAGKVYYAQCSIAMGFFVGHPQLAVTDQAAFFGMGAKLKPVE